MRTTRSAAVLAGTATTILLLAGPASAHVTAHSYDAVSGGEDSEISFRVPNEEKVATTKVLISFPADKPFAGVMPKPKTGWSITSTSVKLATPIKTDDGDISTAISTITWTATAGGTPEGQYDDFDVAVGLLPTTDSVTFKALQTYSNGDVVSWIETGADSEHPAPTLALGKNDEAEEPTASASPSVTATASAAPVAAASDKSSDDSTAKALGGAGLGVAVVAALLALAALVRGRSPKS